MTLRLTSLGAADTVTGSEHGFPAHLAALLSPRAYPHPVEAVELV